MIKAGFEEACRNSVIKVYEHATNMNLIMI